MKKLLPLFLFLIAFHLSAQDFYNLNTIQTIEITFAQSNWDALLDAEKAGDENYIMAQSVVINGEVFDSVGVKYKGNSTYQPNQVKNPFHIELDTYKDHHYQGYKDIKLSNIAKDPSFLREVLSYQILRQYMDAPLSNYANVYVNGNLIGLYSNSEAVSKRFIKDRFGSKNNTFVKCNPPAGAGPQTRDFPNLAYLGTDSSAYYAAYELKSDEGWKDLIELCNTLNNDFANIEQILDIDKVLWMHAFNNVLVNLDSYSGQFVQNYYLYKNDHQQFVPVVWDLNESFGQFSQTGSINLNNTTAKQQMTHLLHANDAGYPLIKQLLSVPMYQRMYLAHIKTILLENFDNGAYKTTAQALQTTIDAAIQADGNKLFSYDNFLANFNSDITSGGGPGGGGPGGGPGDGGPGGGGPGGSATPGITTLMDGRSSYLLGLADFTQTAPTISSITLSNDSPILNETLIITSSVNNGSSVYLNYRNDQNSPFTKVKMLDDGAHNDNGANDGIFGAAITLNSVSTEYYIYAENNNAGIFSPTRAAHEFYTVNASIGESSIEDLVINEFMASNDATIADQDGEFDDWIELYNNGASSIDISGYSLSDDRDNLAQWAFPVGTSIAANSYLIVWADNDEDQAGLHTNFRLSGGGETIYLTDAAGAFVDTIEYNDQTTNISFGRIPNGTGDFQVMNPTFNAENNADADGDGIDAKDDCNDADASIGAKQVPGTPCDDGFSDTQNDQIQSDGCSCTGNITSNNGLVINEIMAANSTTMADQDGEYEDWIELYNNGSASIDLANYFLSDDLNNLMKWAFPAGTNITANGYLTIWADEDGMQVGLHANFKLAASGESVYLVNSEGIIIDQVNFIDQKEDVGYGRNPNGTGDFQKILPTFNSENSMTTSIATLEIPTIGLQASPNPVNQSFYLEINEPISQKRTVLIYNLAGKVVFQDTVFETAQIDVSEWTSGMYIVRVGGAFLKVIVE